MKKNQNKIKKFVKKLATPLILLTSHILSNVRVSKTQDSLIFVVRNRAVQTSADYIEENISKAMLFDSKERLWDFALSKIMLDGLCVEFGVFSGQSINYFSNKIPHKLFFGFDNFEGIREDWTGTSMGKGTFNLDGIPPKVNSNVTLVKGWFDESLPNFLKVHNENFAFLHFDADTYEATVLVLNLIGERIIKGTIVIFDEYLGFPNWQNGEYLAWKQFVEIHKLNYEYLAFARKQTVIRVS
jgi:hypothetical protein